MTVTRRFRLIVVFDAQLLALGGLVGRALLRRRPRLPALRLLAQPATLFAHQVPVARRRFPLELFH